MKYFKDFKKLCTPASVYLFVNVVIFISIAIQNFGNTTEYCVGQYKCRVPNTFSMFLFKAIYILFWTFILNAICKAGYKEVSWFMVLLPILLLFIILGIILLNSGATSSLLEGFKEGNEHGDKKEEQSCSDYEYENCPKRCYKNTNDEKCEKPKKKEDNDETKDD